VRGSGVRRVFDFREGGQGMKRLALAAGVLALGAGTALGLWAVLKPSPALEIDVEAPDFSMVDQEGRTITKADLLGRAWIADFMFTRCAGICPVMKTRFDELNRVLPPGVVLVSFSMDPLRDTPAELKKYAETNNADLKRWRFVSTGTVAKRNEFAKGFMTDAGENPGDPDNSIIHSERFMLVDASGRIRGAYMSSDEEKMAKLRKEARELSLTGVYGLPAVNAGLNGASLLLLLLGLAFAKARRFEEHVFLVLGSVACSTAFLACYLTYHYLAGSTRFPGTGTARTLYLTMLLSHTILAVAVPPLIVTVIVKAIRRRWETHKKWARVTVPIWAYVSATGVLIYWVLFRGSS
jgi:protein SCO1